MHLRVYLFNSDLRVSVSHLSEVSIPFTLMIFGILSVTNILEVSKQGILVRGLVLESRPGFRYCLLNILGLFGRRQDTKTLGAPRDCLRLKVIIQYNTITAHHRNGNSLPLIKITDLDQGHLD